MDFLSRRVTGDWGELCEEDLGRGPFLFLRLLPQRDGRGQRPFSGPWP